MKFDPDHSYNYPITLTGAVYPVTVSWEIVHLPEGERELSLAIFHHDGKTEHAIHGTGSLVIDDPDVRDIALSLARVSSAALEFSLSHNYPNPFNPATVITVSVPRAVRVVLTIFNVLGEEVVTLVNEDRGPGTYREEWKAEAMPSGIYFYRLTADDYSEVKKMVLLR